ncbi:hypothetical protein [Marinobacter xiaoshiensis]|uniref:Uncharacterized protein n=1 Tax=Marinobacter xiaoshiensis TaxID=3073652 RepID=A0ABU2HEK4_9GAMM|nr:hypothetical protein [Marinobacter sp. F60267]MDS1309462.1 hypothetical protein [Marinobacter sp. F60267]
MIVASNNPGHFFPHDEVDFVWLGERQNEVDMIILTLGKNWGGASVDKIDALTQWVSTYPCGVPCYIIGCETTIPSFDFSRFKHEKRDLAVRALCAEVLKRSNSIGVRGDITCKYLTEVLGFPGERVKKIYSSSGKKNIALMRDFISGNDSRLSMFSNDLCRFQKKPAVLYERPLAYTSEITVSQPYITSSAGSCRLNADIKIDSEDITLWLETSEEYSSLLVTECSDAFLSILIPFAMRTGKDIVSESPITEEFFHNMTEILIPQLCAHDRRLYKATIKGVLGTSFVDCQGAVGTGMSCGVDSFYTAKLYSRGRYNSMELSHLYCGNYLYGNDTPVYKRAEAVSNEMGLPLVWTKTNINEVLRLPHLYTHFFKMMFGVLCLRKLFKIYYYSSAEDFSHFNIKNNSTTDTAVFELLLLYCFSMPGFNVVTGGGASERLEKTREIGDFEVAHAHLNVCLDPSKEINCGKCGKCMRTLLMLDMLGIADRFDRVFDVDDYYRNRIRSFKYLVEQKSSSMLSEVYSHFLRSDPELVRRAEEIVKAGKDIP